MNDKNGNVKEKEYCCHCKKELTEENKCFGLTIDMCSCCYCKLSYGD